MSIAYISSLTVLNSVPILKLQHFPFPSILILTLSLLFCNLFRSFTDFWSLYKPINKKFKCCNLYMSYYNYMGKNVTLILNLPSLLVDNTDEQFSHLFPIQVFLFTQRNRVQLSWWNSHAFVNWIFVTTK